jgi:hypothetical protein
MSSPPLRYRLDDFELSHSERALLRAMYKLTRGGIMFFAALKKVARLAGCSKRTASRLINGYTDKRTGSRYRGFLERGILTLIAEAGSGKKAATYRINEDALIPLPRMLELVQQELPGIIPEPKVAPPQQPVSDETPCPATCETPCPAYLEDTVSRRLEDTVSSDLRFIEVPLVREDLQITSSSAIEDDAEEINRVILAFETSPVTTGKANGKDRDLARQLLSPYTPEQIENGITLATARRMCSDPSEHSKVRSLAYFTDPIAEAAADPNLTSEYLERCKRLTARLQRKSEGAA